MMGTGTWYEIRVAGRLDRRWWSWFPGYTIVFEPSGETVLEGNTSDHRQLLGVLVTLHELGHELSSIVRRTDRGDDPHPSVGQATMWPTRIAAGQT